jgi:hypothetical protein
MVHIRYAAPRWQAPRRLGLPGRLLVGALALGIGLAVALLALVSGLLFLATTLALRGWRMLSGPRRDDVTVPTSAPVRQRQEDATDVEFKELP